MQPALPALDGDFSRVVGTVEAERWPLAKPFAIAHGCYDYADVIVVTISANGVVGRGECSPTHYYEETIEGVEADAAAMIDALTKGADWSSLEPTLPAGAARNAVDCALWDLAAKRHGRRIWELVGQAPLVPCETAMTIGLETPAVMATAAAAAVATGHRLIKIKLGNAGDMERLAAVRAAAPDARLIVDANEGWSAENLVNYLPYLSEARVALLEQPMPRDDDSALAKIAHDVPICADESCHTRDDLPRVLGRYDFINIKLDKAGGLTEALALAAAARAHDLGIMIGCMEGTSLAMAPALLLAPVASFVDLDGPLLIGTDRDAALDYHNGIVGVPSKALWG